MNQPNSTYLKVLSIYNLDVDNVWKKYDKWLLDFTVKK